MGKPTTGTREYVGDTFAIEPRGINWAVINGTDLVCIVRGRAPAFEMATRLQRKATYPVMAPAQSANGEKQEPSANARICCRVKPPKAGASEQ